MANFRTIDVSDSSGFYGLSVEVISLDQESKLVEQRRWFLAQNMICTSTRKRGDVRGDWTSVSLEDYDTARKHFVDKIGTFMQGRMTQGIRVVMSDVPILVGLRHDDLKRIANGTMPLARNTPALSTEQLYGKADERDFSLPEGIWETF